MPGAKKTIARNTTANTLITVWSKGMAFFAGWMVFHLVETKYGKDMVAKKLLYSTPLFVLHKN